MLANHQDATVVVGARGFIGAALTTALKRAGRPVIEITRELPLNRGSRLWPSVRTARTIYWAASTINPRIAEEHPDRVGIDRRTLSEFLAELAVDGSRARVVLLSSGGTVYGDDAAPPFSESSEPHPRSAYGIAKLELENDLLLSSQPATIARISNAYGPGQGPAPGQGVIGHWLRALRDGETITVLGGPEILRDYIYIDDITRLLVMLDNQGTSVPPIINVGSGEPTSLSAVLDAVERVSAHHEPQITHLPPRSFDLRESWLDVSLAREHLGWKAETDLSDGVARMWSWVLQERKG